AQYRGLEDGVVVGHDQVAHARQHQAGGDAAALDGGDGRLAEVVDLHALVEVHDLLVAQLALGRVAHGPPRIGGGRVEEAFQVVAGGEVLSGGGEDDNAH